MPDEQRRPCAAPDGEGGLIRAAHVYGKDGYCAICGDYQASERRYSQAELDERVREARREVWDAAINVIKNSKWNGIGNTYAGALIEELRARAAEAKGEVE